MEIAYVLCVLQKSWCFLSSALSFMAKYFYVVLAGIAFLSDPNAEQFGSTTSEFH